MTRINPHELEVGDRVVVNEPILSTEPIHGVVVHKPYIKMYAWVLIVRPDDRRVLLTPDSTGFVALLSDTQREEVAA